MQTIKNPSKEAVRAYLTGRAKAVTPPPSLDEIRMQLGWPMLVKAPDCPR